MRDMLDVLIYKAPERNAIDSGAIQMNFIIIIAAHLVKYLTIQYFKTLFTFNCVQDDRDRPAVDTTPAVHRPLQDGATSQTVAGRQWVRHLLSWLPVRIVVNITIQLFLMEISVLSV